MNVTFKQDQRTGSLAAVLGKDVLNLLRPEGQQHVNVLFSYRVEALAKTDDLGFNTLIRVILPSMVASHCALASRCVYVCAAAS